jgi:hypothetical protein
LTTADHKSVPFEDTPVGISSASLVDWTDGVNSIQSRVRLRTDGLEHAEPRARDDCSDTVLDFLSAAEVARKAQRKKKNEETASKSPLRNY